MPEAKREDKIAAAKRKLRQFKKKREKELKAIKDDTSSLASEDSLVIDSKAMDNSETHPTFLHEVGIEKIAHDLKESTRSKETDKEVNEKEKSLQLDDATSSEEKRMIDAKNIVEETSQTIEDTTEEKVFCADSQENDETGANADERTLINVRDSIELLENLEKSERFEEVCNNPMGGVDTNDQSLHGSNASSASTTESLLQISTKLNGLATESQSIIDGYSNGESPITSGDQLVLTQLEHRNKQLAEHAHDLTRQKQELMMQVEKLTQQMSELHHRLENEKQQIYAHGINEQNTLRQQLQVQMQTIGILVAEKQELQHQVHETRSSADRDQHARQRANDQLQDAKLRLQTLEREAVMITESSELLNSSKSELLDERDHLQMTLNKLRKENEENSMHAGELSQKLAAKEGECNRLSAELTDLHEKLSMAEVLLQQFSNSPSTSREEELLQLQEERENLNQKLIEYQQSFEQLTQEREQLSRQYDDVNKEMQAQVAELTQQVEFLEDERSNLQNEKENLNEIIRNLERENKGLNEEKDLNQNSEFVEEMRRKLQEADVELKRVVAERDEVKHKLNIQLTNNERLARLHEEQEIKLEEFSRDYSESKLSTEEHTKLLEQSLSDKATISRALTQNKRLKEQLEEMQEGFIKLSNDKMELATNLTSMEHQKNELKDEVESYKMRLLEMQHQQVAIRNDDVIAPDQTAAEGLHQGVVMPTSNTLQEELSASQETIILLGEQNNGLKEMVNRLQSKVDSLQQSLPDADQTQTVGNLSESDFPPSDSSEDVNYATITRLMESLNQLKEEKDELSRKYEEELHRHNSLSEHVRDGDHISVEEHQSLVKNMSLLQDRFSSIMRDKVDALSKVEDLEHINLQLQTECDTIGEYIALYHNQRQILKQRHHEKDEYVSSMAQERERLQLQLSKLQSLVVTLFNTRGASDEASSYLSSVDAKSYHEKTTSDDDSITTDHTSQTSDWPDMTEDKKPRPDLLPEHTSLPHHDVAEKHSSPPKPGHLREMIPINLERDNEEDEETRTAIFDLLKQIQQPTVKTQKEFPQGFCLRYMGPYTAI